MHCLPFMGVEFEPMDSASCSGRNTMIPLHVWSYDWRLKYWGRSHCSHTVPWLSSMGISWSVHPWAAQDAVTPWHSDFRVFFAHGSHRLGLVRPVALAKFGVHRIKMVGHICIPDSENWFHLWLPVPWVSCWPLYRIGRGTVLLTRSRIQSYRITAWYQILQSVDRRCWYLHRRHLSNHE